MPRHNHGPRLFFNKERGYYYIRWTENGRSRTKSTFTRDRALAEEALAAFIHERRRYINTGPRDPSEYGIGDALVNYAMEHAQHTLTADRIGYAMQAVERFWGGRMIGGITPALCRKYAEERGVSDGTIRRELGVLRAAINHEYKQNRITRPVFVQLPPKPDGKDRWLTRDEAAGLLWHASRHEHARSYLPRFILLGLYTGARKGTLLSLRWPQIDLANGRIDLNPIGRQRTTKGKPVIPIPRGLRWFLTKWAAQDSDVGFVVNRNGHPLKDVKRSFETACERAGIEGVTPHVLRHTAGTWMAQRGVEYHEIGGFLGHSYERTTELYAHHHPDHLKHAREALD